MSYPLRICCLCQPASIDQVGRRLSAGDLSTSTNLGILSISPPPRLCQKHLFHRIFRPSSLNHKISLVQVITCFSKFVCFWRRPAHSQDFVNYLGENQVLFLPNPRINSVPEQRRRDTLLNLQSSQVASLECLRS